VTHLYNQPISVRAHVDGCPRQFIWRGSIHEVARVVDAWILQTMWWQAEVHRSYYRVITPEWGVYDLFREKNQWYIATRLD